MACVLIGIPACHRDGTLTVADAGAKDLPELSFAEDAAVDLAPPLDMTWLCTADRECTDDRFCQAGQCLPWASSPRGDHLPDGPPIVTAREVTCFDLLAAEVCNRGGSATAGPVAATFHGSDCAATPRSSARREHPARSSPVSAPRCRATRRWA